MQIDCGTPAQLPPGLMERLGRYRYQVFVQRLGWPLRCKSPFEYDQFDRADTVHLVTRDAQGEVCGVARLLPTTRPYLLGDVFTQLLGALPRPSHAQLWELSRFATVDLRQDTQGPCKPFASAQAADLLRHCLAAAASRGATEVLTVSPVGVERLLQRAGFAAQRLAAPVRLEAGTLCALRIRCPPQARPLSLP